MTHAEPLQWITANEQRHCCPNTTTTDYGPLC